MTLFSKKPEETSGAQTLGMRIAEARKKHGYTQEDFSQKLNVTAQAVSKWENDLSCLIFSFCLRYQSSWILALTNC